MRCESARHPNGVPAPSPPRAISTLVPAASLASEQTAGYTVCISRCLQRERGETAVVCCDVTLCPPHSANRPQPPPLPARGRLSFLLSPTRLSHGSLGVFLLLLLCFASALPSFPLLGTAREGILRCESARHPNGVPAPSPPRAISTLVPAASLASEQTIMIVRPPCSGAKRSERSDTAKGREGVGVLGWAALSQESELAFFPRQRGRGGVVKRQNRFAAARAAIERHSKRLSAFWRQKPAAVFNGACSNYFSRYAKGKRDTPRRGLLFLE